jgi:signal transduction histidine kinase
MRRARRLLPTGLRWRLAAWVAAVVLISSAITFAAVYRGTGTRLRSQVDRELAGDLGELSQVAGAAARTPPRTTDTPEGAGATRRADPASRSATTTGAATTRRIAAAATGYVRNQPFSAGSTLQFAIVQAPGGAAVTVTNRPELLHAGPPDHGETAAEQRREDVLSQRLLTAPPGYSTLSLPDVGSLRLIKSQLRLAGGVGVTLGVGERLATVADAQRGVAEAFILAGALTLMGALAGAYLIGTHFSRPLRRMADVAARVDAGDLHPRIRDAGSGGEEMRVLAESFNHMLDRLTDAFAGQRAFVADASHELRTPLTVIRGQLEVLAAQPAPDAEEVRRVERLVQAEVARIGRLVDDLLLLAKAEQTEFLRPREIALAPYVRELWDGVALLAPRRFQLGAIPDGTLRADPDRLAQALRNLLANAIAHTTPGEGMVRLEVERLGPARVRFVVADDGPGIPPEQRERVFDRFHRTDAARDRASGGTGLGLAIVRAIAEAHGGRVCAGTSPEGGARIELELPGFSAAGGAGAPTATAVGTPARAPA